MSAENRERQVCVMTTRRRVKQITSLEQRLADQAKRLREKAKLLPHGATRDTLIRKARETEAAVHMSDWLHAPSLQLPK